MLVPLYHCTTVLLYHCNRYTAPLTNGVMLVISRLSVIVEYKKAFLEVVRFVIGWGASLKSKSKSKI